MVKRKPKIKGTVFSVRPYRKDIRLQGVEEVGGKNASNGSSPEKIVALQYSGGLRL
jgi:hypothetical protein